MTCAARLVATMAKKEFRVPADWLPEPMLRVSSDGVIEAANRAFAVHFQIAAETLPETRLDALAVDSSGEIDAFLRACVQTKHPTAGLLTLRGGDRTMVCRTHGLRQSSGTGPRSVWVLLRFEPGAESGAPLPILNHALGNPNAEIVQHQQVEDSLRRQRETLEVTLSSIGDAVIVTNAQGRVTFMNAVAEELTGWTVQAANDEPLEGVFRIVNERTGRPVDNPVTKVLETGGIVGLANHTVLLARDGRRIPIDDSAAPIRLPSGELFGIVLIFRDITARKRAEATRAWLAAIVDSSDDAIVGKTLDGIVTSWNPGATRLFGYQLEEMIGRPIATLIPPELHAEEVEVLARLRRGECVNHYETVRLAKDGRRVDISLTVSPVRDEEGVIIGASKIARDISARKAAEIELRDANRRKDEFLATLSHELRNPLAPMRSVAELLKRAEGLAPDLHAASTILERQVRHMSHLIDDLLDMSRITTGHVRLEREPLDLVLLLAAALETYRPVLESARHEVTFSPPVGPVHIEGDRIRLTQVFSNILHNAAKYTPPAGRIRVQIHQVNGEALVRVRDSGVGIPPAMLTYIFEPFARVDGSAERGDRGLGIGLTIAKTLLELHGGRIEAKSDGPNQGSEFIVRLPVIRPPLSQRERTAGSSAHHSAGRKVLIADDNHDAAVTLSMLLQAMGHDTRVAHDGVEALEVAEDFHPHVVLLDLGMPKLDGCEAARRMASRPWARTALLVAVTGWGQDTDRQRTQAAGFHRHLVKPVDLDALGKLIDEADAQVVRTPWRPP
jgi:PAS domain S-box-containing protein